MYGNVMEQKNSSAVEIYMPTDEPELETYGPFGDVMSGCDKWGARYRFDGRIHGAAAKRPVFFGHGGSMAAQRFCCALDGQYDNIVWFEAMLHHCDKVLRSGRRVSFEYRIKEHNGRVMRDVINSTLQRGHACNRKENDRE